MNTTLRDTHLQYDATTPPMLLHSNEYTVWKKKLNLFLRITTVSKDKLAITVFNRIDPGIIDLMTLFDESLILDNTPVADGIFPDAQNTKGLEYLGDTLEQYFKHDSFLESKRLLDDITQFKRLPDESYRACSERFRQLYSTYQKYSCTLSEVQLTQFFMNGLRLSQSDEHSLRTHLNYVHKLTSTSEFTLKAMTDSIDTLFSYIPAVSKPDNMKSEANVVGTGKGKGKGKSSRFGGKPRSKGKSTSFGNNFFQTTDQSSFRPYFRPYKGKGRSKGGYRSSRYGGKSYGRRPYSLGYQWKPYTGRGRSRYGSNFSRGFRKGKGKGKGKSFGRGKGKAKGKFTPYQSQQSNSSQNVFCTDFTSISPDSKQPSNVNATYLVYHRYDRYPRNYQNRWKPRYGHHSRQSWNWKYNDYGYHSGYGHHSWYDNSWYEWSRKPRVPVAKAYKPNKLSYAHKISDVPGHEFQKNGTIYAILDTACNKSIASESWLAQYMDVYERRFGTSAESLQYLNSNVTFKYANGQKGYAKYAVNLPLRLGSRNVLLETHVVPGTEIELLIPMGSMQKLGLNINLATNTVSSDYLGIYDFPLEFNIENHPCIPAIWTESMITASKENVSGSINLTTEEILEIEETYPIVVRASEAHINCLSQTRTDSMDFETAISHVLRVKGTEDFTKPKNIIKLHIQLGHCSSERLYHLISNAYGGSSPVTKKFVQTTVLKCSSCLEHKPRPISQKIGGHLAYDFNHLVFLYLVFLEIETKRQNKPLIICHLLDCHSRFSYANIVPDKSPESVIETLIGWRNIAGGPPNRIFTDRGGEFVNNKMTDFCSLYDIEHRTTAANNPQSNGLCERRGGIIKHVFQKVVHDGILRQWKISLESLLNLTLAGINAQPVIGTYSPFQIATGRVPNLSIGGINDENISTHNDPRSLSEAVYLA